MALSVIGSDFQSGATASLDWEALQLSQFEHDEKYHREICRLPMQDRLRHMALHFAKYAGRLQDEPTDSQFRQVAVDTFIIAVSCANILNVDLTSALQHGVPAGLTRESFARRLSVAAGQMAAACEKLDHLEDFPFRRTLTTEALAILVLCVELFACEAWDPMREMTNRLVPIKSKSIFHGKI